MRMSTSLLACTAWWTVTLSPAPALAQYGATGGEWRSYAGDPGSTKYSPLDQIDATNFEELRIAWRWQSADGALDLDAHREQRSGISIRGLQVTPLMVDGTLYLSTAMYQAAAIDAGSGETVWVYDPQVYLGGQPTHGYGSRGVAYWTDGQDERIFWGTSEGYLLAVDPETGLLYVPSENRFSVLKYYTPDPAESGNLRFTQAEFGSGAQPTMPEGLPLLKPPYSRMTAIDLNEGEHAWMRPNGDGDRYRNHPRLRDLDLPPLGGEGHGGPLLTKTLLISALNRTGFVGGLFP